MAAMHASALGVARARRVQRPCRAIDRWLTDCYYLQRCVCHRDGNRLRTARTGMGSASEQEIHVKAGCFVPPSSFVSPGCLRTPATGALASMEVRSGQSQPCRARNKRTIWSMHVAHLGHLAGGLFLPGRCTARWVQPGRSSSCPVRQGPLPQRKASGMCLLKTSRSFGAWCAVRTRRCRGKPACPA